MKHGESWTCPYCSQPTTITDPNFDEQLTITEISKALIDIDSRVGYHGVLIACPNQKCKKLTFIVQLVKVYYDEYRRVREAGEVIARQILPESTAKPQPNYIPKQIVEDYTEACRIKSLSPKASATLARRCLQGMIRDFWSISVSSKKLADEINAIKTNVSSSDWDAIDAVRSVGNIGAHMEQDVDLIIDVEPKEAELLIRLIEDLFQNWYVTRHEHEERNKQIVAMAQSKKTQKNNANNSKKNP